MDTRTPDSVKKYERVDSKSIIIDSEVEHILAKLKMLGASINFIKFNDKILLVILDTEIEEMNPDEIINALETEYKGLLDYSTNLKPEERTNMCKYVPAKLEEEFNVNELTINRIGHGANLLKADGNVDHRINACRIGELLCFIDPTMPRLIDDNDINMQPYTVIAATNKLNQIPEKDGIKLLELLYGKDLLIEVNPEYFDLTQAKK